MEKLKVQQLVIDIARELYDRFVMGGWEPPDAYPLITGMLERAGVTEQKLNQE